MLISGRTVKKEKQHLMRAVLVSVELIRELLMYGDCNLIESC